MEEPPLPTTLEEVEGLITALYEPRPPDTIARIQDVLQRLQRSPQGWSLAQSLLTRSDDKIKFFGALTLIVKLNTESSSLSEDDAKELLRNLLGWLVQSLQDGSGALVTKKLCSALVTYFIHFSPQWPDCLRHLAQCLDLGRGVPAEEADDRIDTASLIAQLDFRKLQAAIWFAATFVEEVGKTDMNSVRYAGAHQKLAQNGQDVTRLLSRGLSPNFDEQSNLKTQVEAIACLQAWISYAQRTSGASDALISPLRSLIGHAMGCLVVDDLYEPAIELLTDVLSNYSGFFVEEHYNALSSLFTSSWAQERYRTLMEGDSDFESVQFGLFMIAYGDAKVQNLTQSPDEQSQRFLSGLAALLATPGHPVAEDRIFVPALEFWSTFVETMTDAMYSDEEAARAWLPRARSHTMQVVSNCWRKIQFPPQAVFASWDSTERAGFGDARKDVADLLQSVFSVSGPPLVSLFVDLLLQSLSNNAWAELEAAAFCLGSLSDCVSDEATCDDMLDRIFASSFFDLLGQAQGQQIPVRLRQTGLTLIERYSDYFERHARFLPAALNLLFGAVGDTVLAGPSSRSIATLCSSCRSLLTGEVGAFLRQYDEVHASPSIDTIAEERIVTAIASIIQAITDEQQRLHAFEQLLASVHRDVERSLHLKAHPETLDLHDAALMRGYDPSQGAQGAPSPDDVSLQVALRALRCLAGMARGMQTVVDGPVDLDGDAKSGGGGGAAASRDEHLARLQGGIMMILVKLQTTFPSSGEVVETICNVLRAGFSESEPGPFLFPKDVITDFFVHQRFASPRIGTLVSTSCSFVSSLGSAPDEQVAAALTRLLPWVVGLLHELPETESDPELSQNGIDFVHRLMARRPEVLLNLQPTSSLEFFFMFTLRVLSGKEPLPKVTAADFWSAFITLKSQDAARQASIGSAMEHLGPLVARSLVHNVGGGASRSELDKVADPLKKLVVQHVRAHAWLEAALLGPDFPSTKVSAQDKMLFLKKVVSLRGARATNQVVRDFWLACRGSNFAYAS